MSPRYFPIPGILMTGLALVLLTALPAQAQTAAKTTPATISPVAAPERILERSDLLPHLETIRRQYPRLYDRLRREIPPDQLQQARAASAPVADSTSAVRATAPRAIPIDTLLRQDVRLRAAQASSIPTTAAGASR